MSWTRGSPARHCAARSAPSRAPLADRRLLASIAPRIASPGPNAGLRTVVLPPRRKRAGSATRGALALTSGIRPPRIAIRREFFSNDLTDGVESRTTVDVLEQRVVDQCLVVSTTGPIYCSPKELDRLVVEANRDLRLPWLGLHDGSALRAREIDVAILLSYGLFHRLPSDACSSSRQRSAGWRQGLGTCKPPRAGSPGCSGPASQTSARQQQ